MAVASHRNYVSSTMEDLERAAGRFKQIYNASGYALDASNGTDMACAAYGAAIALYAMSLHDVRDADEMLNIWTMMIDMGGSNGTE